MFCGNCSARCSGDVLRKLVWYGLLVIIYPAHTSHLFQVLDVLLFGILKRARKYQRRDEKLSNMSIMSCSYFGHTNEQLRAQRPGLRGIKQGLIMNGGMRQFIWSSMNGKSGSRPGCANVVSRCVVSFTSIILSSALEGAEFANSDVLTLDNTSRCWDARCPASTPSLSHQTRHQLHPKVPNLRRLCGKISSRAQYATVPRRCS